MTAEDLHIGRVQLYEDWLRIAAERLQQSLIKKKVGDTGDLNYSMLYDLKSALSDEPRLLHEFNYYGKFVDMGVGRGQKIEDVKTNADLYKLLKQGRRPKKWFSKTYYAEVQTLVKLLSERYGIDAQHIIIENITNGN